MFTELWKDALVALLVIAGYQWAGSRPTGARRAARAAAAISATALASVIVSGAWRPSPEVVAYHRGASHGLVILDWLLVFAAIGVAARLSFARRPWQAVGQILVLVLVLCFTFLTAFTGYLGPTHTPNAPEETQNRFFVLHCVALPLIVAALTFIWFRLFRAAKPTSDESESSAPGAGDNPGE